MKILGYEFKCHDLGIQAVTHHSVACAAGVTSNERLEFLGDAMLNACLAARLYIQFPSKSPGELTNIRSALVCTSALAKLAKSHDLDRMIHTLKDGSSDKDLCDMLEAIIAAIYLDGGLGEVEKIISYLFGEKLSDQEIENPKGVFLDFATSKKWKISSVTNRNELEAIYTCQIFRGDVLLSEGTGSSKKNAEVNAYRSALNQCLLD